MAHPPIQVVDENDQPLFAMSRDQARAEGLFHRIVRVMLFDNNGNLLLQKRSATVDFPNLWDHSAAGHVDAGEDYITAANRELHEELGIKTDLRESAYYKTEENIFNFLLKRFNKIYTGKINFTPKDFSRAEVAAVKWVNFDEFKKDLAKNPDKYGRGLPRAIKEMS